MNRVTVQIITLVVTLISVTSAGINSHQQHEHHHLRDIDSDYASDDIHDSPAAAPMFASPAAQMSSFLAEDTPSVDAGGDDQQYLSSLSDTAAYLDLAANDDNDDDDSQRNLEAQFNLSHDAEDRRITNDEDDAPIMLVRTFEEDENETTTIISTINASPIPVNNYVTERMGKSDNSLNQNQYILRQLIQGVPYAADSSVKNLTTFYSEEDDFADNTLFNETSNSNSSLEEVNTSSSAGDSGATSAETTTTSTETPSPVHQDTTTMPSSGGSSTTLSPTLTISTTTTTTSTTTTSAATSTSSTETMQKMPASTIKPIPRYGTIDRPKHHKQSKHIKKFRASANDILRLFLEDSYLRSPLAILVDTSSIESLTKTKALWNATLKRATPIDMVLVSYDTTGKYAAFAIIVTVLSRLNFRNSHSRDITT